MTNRDEELDDLQRDLAESLRNGATPFIDTPDQMRAGDGSMCWLDAGRRCGATCIAYNWQGIGLGEGEIAQGAKQCTVLATQISKSNELIDLVASTRAVVTAMQDRRREEQTRKRPGAKL